LVDECPASQQRILRYVSRTPETNQIPANPSVVFVACLGDAFQVSGRDDDEPAE
jgi:hypothetical protein